MISVIIPLYNAENSIEKALNSIKTQTWKGDFEIIIVNDGSTDTSREVVENYMKDNPQLDILLINQDNSGVSKARNRGLELAEGEYIALLDADDEWLPAKIERQLNYLANENLNVDFITSLWNDEQVRFPYVINPKNELVKITLPKLLLQVTGQTSTALFKIKILENTGYFDENQNYSEDANFWMRITEENQMYLLPEQLVIAGNGKKSFGFSGLSANLKEMEKGIQKNIWEMYQTQRINVVQYVFYFVISKVKYWVRPLRAKL